MGLLSEYFYTIKMRQCNQSSSFTLKVNAIHKWNIESNSIVSWKFKNVIRPSSLSFSNKNTNHIVPSKWYTRINKYHCKIHKIFL